MPPHDAALQSAAHGITKRGVNRYLTESLQCGGAKPSRVTHVPSTSKYGQALETWPPPPSPLHQYRQTDHASRGPTLSPSLVTFTIRFRTASLRLGVEANNIKATNQNASRTAPPSPADGVSHWREIHMRIPLSASPSPFQDHLSFLVCPRLAAPWLHRPPQYHHPIRRHPQP